MHWRRRDGRKCLQTPWVSLVLCRQQAIRFIQSQLVSATNGAICLRRDNTHHIHVAAAHGVEFVAGQVAKGVVGLAHELLLQVASIQCEWSSTSLHFKLPIALITSVLPLGTDLEMPPVTASNSLSASGRCSSVTRSSSLV